MEGYSPQFDHNAEIYAAFIKERGDGMTIGGIRVWWTPMKVFIFEKLGTTIRGTDHSPQMRAKLDEAQERAIKAVGNDDPELLLQTIERYANMQRETRP